MPRIDLSDLSIFEFDYDVTMYTFFINAEEKVYSRYGGRDAESADSRQSLAGMRSAMEAVLQEHSKGDKASFAPRSGNKPLYIRESSGGGGGRCLHCHQVKEQLNSRLVREDLWSRDSVYRYPLPENIGLTLSIDKGNVVDLVAAGSAAEKVGIKKGDVLRRIDQTPVHTFGDAQFALDRAAIKGDLKLEWQRGTETLRGTAEMAYGWKKSDLTWRPSMHRLLPQMPVYGKDLSAAERKELGLSEKQMAYRLGDRFSQRARDAGAQPNDVVIGFNDLKLDLTADAAFEYVKREFLVGDTLNVKIIRGKERLVIPIVLANR